MQKERSITVNENCTHCFTDGTFAAEIKHVHQLQNLYFALTGEELTLKDKASEEAENQYDAIEIINRSE